MIKYDYTVTVTGNTAKLDKDIYLFRGNKNVHYYFAIKNASFNFKGTTDLIEKTNAINAAVTVVKPNAVEVANAIAEVENGKIHLKVTEDLIDEEVEVGDFDLVFDLFDDTDGAVTIPKVAGQFHVLERPCTTPISELAVATNTTNEVDYALTDYAITTYAEPVASTNEDGTFAKKTWQPKEKITTAELNRIEEGIFKNSSQYKDIANLKIDNITLSDNVLTFFANSKTIKTITLPTSTTGGGTNGKEIELQKSTTHIQWRYVGDTDWTNLVALSDLKGTDGDTGLSAYELAQQETGFAGTVEQWLNSLVGATPNLAIGTVETLASGSSATASITGTTENPLLNLGIPRGNDGASGTGGNSEGWELIDDVIFEETVSTYAKTFDKEYDEINIFLLNLDSESISDSWSNLTLNPSNGNINIRTGTVETNKGLFININRLGNHYIYYVANNVMTSSVLGANIRLFYGLGSTSSKIKGLSFGSSSILKATNRLIIAGR